MKTNVVIVGDSKVGKTSMILAYTNYQDFIKKNYIIPNKNISLPEINIIDNQKIDLINVTIICFSIANHNSFDNIQKYASLYPHIPILLVGTKHDLRHTPHLKYKIKKKVSYVQIIEMAKKIKAEQYVECSAITNHNIHMVFETAMAISNNNNNNNNICQII